MHSLHSALACSFRLALADCQLHVCSRLQLDLSSNRLGPEGAKALAPALVRSSLTVLILSHNKIEDEGAIAIGHALRDNADCKMQTLELVKCGMRAGGAKALAAFCAVSASLTKILVGGNGLGDEGTIILCDALRESTVSKVEELNLRNNFIRPDGAKAIAALCAVRGSLTKLNLIRGFDLVSGHQLGDEGTIILCDALRESTVSNVEELDLQYNQIGPNGAKAIAALCAVRGSLTAIGEGGLNPKYNRLGDEGWGAIFTGVCSNKDSKISSIDVSHESIGLPGAKLIAEALQKSVAGSLTKISLAQNKLEEKGTKVICEALKGNETLKELDLSGDGPLGRRNIGGPAGAKHVANMLSASSSLTKILVGGNGLGDEGTIILCDALRESTVSKMEELDLRLNEIGPDGARAIAALCAVRGSLTSVRASPELQPIDCHHVLALTSALHGIAAEPL